MSRIFTTDIKTLFFLSPDSMITLFESPISAHIDGQPGGGCSEVMWTNSLIDYVQRKQEVSQ